MARKSAPDKWLFAATVGLALFGVVMVYSASAVMAQKENTESVLLCVEAGRLGADWFCRDVAGDAVQLPTT